MEITSTQVCEELLLCVKRLKAVMAELAEAHQLTVQQLYALQAVQQGHATMGQLAAFLHCDASNVTGIVDRLVAHRLVARRENPQDRRTKMLHLTERGNQLINDVQTKMPGLLGCEKLSQADRAALHHVILKLG